jgi:hypothetical protein
MCSHHFPTSFRTREIFHLPGMNPRLHLTSPKNLMSGQMPPRIDDFTTIDVGGDWSRLRLLCEEPKPRRALECAMRQWLKFDAKRHHEAVSWTLRRALRGEAPAPWELSRTDYWTRRIDNAVQEAVETEEAGALVGRCAEMAAFANVSAQLLLSDVDAKTTRLRGVAAKTRRRIAPSPDSP